MSDDKADEYVMAAMDSALRLQIVLDSLEQMMVFLRQHRLALWGHYAGLPEGSVAHKDCAALFITVTQRLTWIEGQIAAVKPPHEQPEQTGSVDSTATIATLH